MTREHLCGFLRTAMMAATLSFTLCAPFSWAMDGDIAVIASDATSVTVKVTVSSPEVNEVTLPDGLYTRVRVPGWATTVTPGLPELPQKGVVIQVPSSGSVAVETSTGPSSSLPGLLPPYSPTLKLSDDGVVVKEYKSDRSAYGAAGFFPEKVAEVERIGIVRGVPVARLMLRPFQWNPATGELRYYTEITAKVLFGDSLSGESAVSSSTADASSGTGLSGSLAQTIVNYRGPVSRRGQSNQSALSKSFAAATVGAVKVSVKEDGIYRITGAKLMSKGVAVANITPSTFRLLHMGSEVAIRVSIKGKKFAAGDYIEFYGKGVNNTFTDTNVYWLSWGGEAGKRMTALDGTVTGQGTSRTSFVSTVAFEENHVAWGLTPGAPDGDFWFWEKIDAPSTNNYTFALSSVSSSSGTATVRVTFRGRTTALPNPNHHTILRLNGTLIADNTWDGNGEYTQEAEIAVSLLKEGTNTLTVETPGDTGAEVDTIYLNRFEIAYPRAFNATGNTLTFPVEGNGRLAFTIAGLTQTSANVYDITDPTQVGIFSGFTVAKPSRTSKTYNAVMEGDVAGEKTLLAVTDKATSSPASLEAWTSTGLQSAANGADYILVTPRDFLTSLTSLIALRQKNGLRVKAVAVEDIYNEFSHGLVTPQAIKDFLLYAYENWQTPAPTYVLLVGDGTYDYRDYLGTGKKSRVPVHLYATSSLGITPDDNWYVAVEGDDVLPEMIIGRIPAASKSAAASMASKVVTYEKAAKYVPKEALFAADNGDSYFETIADEMISGLTTTITPRRVYLGSYASAPAATGDLISRINSGMMLTAYVGHGDVTHWAGEGLLTSDTVAKLANGSKLSFVVTLDCLNGWFAEPSKYSIGETLVVARGKGAIAAFSPSGLGYTSEHRILGNTIIASMFGAGNRTAGVIATGSKIAAYGRGVTEDTVRIFTLLGDPATQLKGAK